ncbi:5-amino-6-(5-phospho-D-ribitylamino)uracil phosphatase, chloroplastic [Linum grandiflorum]
MECCSCSSGRNFTCSPSSSSLLLPSRPSRVPHTRPSLKLKLSKPKRQQSLIATKACNGSVNGFPVPPDKLFSQEAIIAEYSEGSETFRQDGPLKVDVADTRTMKMKIWKQFASEEVSRSGIPCVVVSSRDRISTVKSLERMGLKKYFQAIVSKEDGMESIAHRFLSAAVKLDRKPSKCVVFEDDPRGVTAAHNCTMMAVALIGVHPAYELVQADLAVVIYNELLVINLRRLYANKGSTFMDREKKRIKKSHPK